MHWSHSFTAIKILKTHSVKCLYFMPNWQQKNPHYYRHNISRWSKCGKIRQKQVPLCHCLVTVLAEFARHVPLFSTLFLGTHVHFTMELPSRWKWPVFTLYTKFRKNTHLVSFISPWMMCRFKQKSTTPTDRQHQQLTWLHASDHIQKEQYSDSVEIRYSLWPMV